MADITERLREHPAFMSTDHIRWYRVVGPDGDCQEAADEIDSLRAKVAALEADAKRYRWLCIALGQTQLPTLIERITAGYVADYKPSIDAAIDAAMQAKEPTK